MVRWVDHLLRTRFGEPRGIASDKVTLIDPALGTGRFVLGLLRHLAADRDPAALCALLPMLPDGAHAVTADMYVQHMRPARPGATLRIVARVLRMGRSLAFCEADVMDGETRCSTARVTKAVVRAK